MVYSSLGSHAAFTLEFNTDAENISFPTALMGDFDGFRSSLVRSFANSTSTTQLSIFQGAHCCITLQNHILLSHPGGRSIVLWYRLFHGQQKTIFKFEVGHGMFLAFSATPSIAQSDETQTSNKVPGRQYHETTNT
jgi:hypothetical protein